MFRKVLIANRGVIGYRILKTLRENNIRSVSVYTPGDKNSLHVTESDESICIRAYNEIPEIISAARHFKVNAIHPGVGFLSENIDFARVANHYSVFIGPDTSLFIKMGNKVKARMIADEAEIPKTPGSRGPLKNEKEALNIAGSVGYPVIIKAAAGGGGMGMERVVHEEDMTGAFKRVKEQAKTLFGNEDVYIEKLIHPNRHIEVQVLADNHGNVVHFGERDCSIQRSHQKLIEFSPADISEDLRQAITGAACALTKAIGYKNAGTVEFLVDEKENFYFMEMNTRIQVEHRVTEMVYRRDLIHEQLRSAAGEKLGYSQDDLKSYGYAIECRVNAEDPDKDFEASPGIIEKFIPPEGKNMIVDTFIPRTQRVIRTPEVTRTQGVIRVTGTETFPISTTYDSLLANVITWGKDKKSALKLMKEKLSEFVIEGKDIKTTIPFHLEKIKELGK